MKKITIIATLVIAMPALAGDYAYENGKREMCTMVGQYASAALANVQKGERPFMEGKGRDYLTPLFVYVEKEVTDNTAMYDRKSAHMMGWSNCMDKIDRLTRDYNASR